MDVGEKKTMLRAAQLKDHYKNKLTVASIQDHNTAIKSRGGDRNEHKPYKVSSALSLPYLSSISCAFGTCISAETGRQPSSDKKGLIVIAALAPPHCPALYVAISEGLNENKLDPKWF